ncbi:hypothetical protein [Asanoa siamensis]|uniref:Translation initiation factor IF-2 n=1 Tax=Asanoa siamensis TaxID=926357 RepID=A0ABQ4CUP9_9ACTN|nr:hypothetical protein [Asanoa siamensis]GIF74995.1 hypothetical protein Asi02nite_45130 [Asanoa siamensis]
MADPRDDAALDRMLDGGPLPPALAALRAPAHPAELRGEEAAVAAFRAAREPGPVATPAAARRARIVGRALAVKLAVAGAVLAGGGLAVAAATGTLPVQSPVRPATTDPTGPARPGGVVNEPGRAPHAPAGVTPPATPGPTTHGPGNGHSNGNGNGWGRGHGSGKPSKDPKPTKEPKASKEPKGPKDKPTVPPGQS